MAKVLLLIPPDYDRHYPPLGTPALTAFLRAKGIRCDQIDLNFPYRDFLASYPTCASYPQGRGGLNLPYPVKYYAACLPGEDAAGIPYGNNTNSSFYFCERLLASSCLWRYLEDEEENTFLRYYRACGVLDRLAGGGIDIVGLSIISPTQAVASLTLGLLIKKEMPGIHVTIGGQWPTLYRDAILRQKELFRAFDSIVVGEGEMALLSLVRSLEGKRSVAGLPHILTREAEPGACPRAAEEEDMDRLPCPDFDGLPLADYDGSADGEISLTYETSRGCYWSKCAYCVDLPLPKPSYRRKKAALVARDMAELKRRFGAQHLLLGDPGLSPRQMAEVSRHLIACGVTIGWWTMARLDPGFTRELFGLAASAGLRQVNFGFESACDRVCRGLDKGNERGRSSRVIRDCASAGINVDLQTMLGLPGESFADGLETVDFLVSHKVFISHATFNTYYLTPGNHVYHDPDRYGIIPDESVHLPFRFFVPFRHREGMAPAETKALQKIHEALAEPAVVADTKASATGEK